jgi:hypothetical protein
VTRPQVCPADLDRLPAHDAVPAGARACRGRIPSRALATLAQSGCNNHKRGHHETHYCEQRDLEGANASAYGEETIVLDGDDTIVTGELRRG